MPEYSKTPDALARLTREEYEVTQNRDRKSVV